MNQDFRDLIAAFNDQQVEFLIVGAHALAAHGHVRATKDLDVWVRPSVDNAHRVIKALTSFGAPLHDLSVDDLCTPELVFQIGVAPMRIDLLTSVSGLDFDAAWERREMVDLGGLSVPVLSLEDLATNKRATGRPQDLVDLRWIDEALE